MLGLGVRGFPAVGLLVLGHRATFTGHITRTTGVCGIQTYQGAANFTLGEDGSPAPTLVSGNLRYGATLMGPGARVSNTYFGLDVTGEAALPNMARKKARNGRIKRERGGLF